VGHASENLKPPQTHKWWRDLKADWKKVCTVTITPPYDLAPMVFDPATRQSRAAYPSEIASNVRYWLGLDANGEETLEIPFIFEDPHDKVRGIFVPQWRIF
jgi:hypothetical protein